MHFPSNIEIITKPDLLKEITHANGMTMRQLAVAQACVNLFMESIAHNPPQPDRFFNRCRDSIRDDLPGMGELREEYSLTDRIQITLDILPGTAKTVDQVIKLHIGMYRQKETHLRYHMNIHILPNGETRQAEYGCPY